MEIKVEIKELKEKPSLDEIVFSIHIENAPVKNYDKIPDLSERIEKAFQDYFAIKEGVNKSGVLKDVIEGTKSSTFGSL